MTQIRVGAGRYDIDLIIFDKDGTLFEFRAMWTRILRQQVETLQAAVGGDGDLAVAIYADMGTDPEGKRMDARGPLALATYEDMRAIMALHLYRRGWFWDDARRLVDEVTDEKNWPPLHELVYPIGDVSHRLPRLRAAGIRLGLLTTDVRSVTLTMLGLAGLREAMDAIVCADDGLPLKPAGDGVLAICERLGCAPDRTMLVGDAVPDMLAGRAASVAVCVGVLSGVSGRAELETTADVILDSIMELDIA